MADIEPYSSKEITVEQIREVYEAANQVVADLQLALALIQKYQRALNMVGCPDPEILTANQLLRDHGIPVQTITHFFRVYTDGIDITEHADSLEGDAVEIEVKEIEAGD
jgi:hypothetical protein